MENEKEHENGMRSYDCKICSKDMKNDIGAITHYLDHGSTALNAVNTMIKDQRMGSVTAEDRSRIASDAAKVAATAAEAASKVSAQNLSNV